ncbi:MAG: hypothetical protein V4676_08410, partial [Bacteroidota bacterium]
MKKWICILMVASLLSLQNYEAHAQCSVCTRSTQQMGEKPAKGLNAGIIYLAFAPLVLMGFFGYKW